jgi:hypothetical protein
MGSSIAPKTFARSGAQGASDASNPVTQVQPQAQVASQGVPDFTAYGGQQAQPGPADSNADVIGGAGSAQDLLQQFRQRRGNAAVPFYGAMS